jgi:LmbE family N-acetylglucosaminyl deacetylase
MNAVIERHKPRIPASAISISGGEPPFTDTTPEKLVSTGSRVVLVAPHPDDEILALGATLAALSDTGHDILIVAVTDGEGSHPASRRWTPDALRDARPRESRLALRRLALTPEVLRLGLPDGGVANREKELAELLPLGTNDTVFVPWRHDGHADHEACARATLAACRTVGARCVEFPVWALVPGHAAHPRLRHRMLQRVALETRFLEAKHHAMAAFSTQIEPDGPTQAVLQAKALSAWSGRSEWVLG